MVRPVRETRGLFMGRLRTFYLYCEENGKPQRHIGKAGTGTIRFTFKNTNTDEWLQCVENMTTTKVSLYKSSSKRQESLRLQWQCSLERSGET